MKLAEKATVIALVRASPLPHKQVLSQLGLPESTLLGAKTPSARIGPVITAVRWVV